MFIVIFAFVSYNPWWDTFCFDMHFGKIYPINQNIPDAWVLDVQVNESDNTKQM